MTERIFDLAAICIYFMVAFSLFATPNIFGKNVQILILALEFILIFGCIFRGVKHLAEYGFGWKEGIVLFFIFSVSLAYVLWYRFLRIKPSL
jgi:membrane protein implicated in regulation of membrane protease activity